MKAQLFTLLAAAAVGTGTVQARGEYAEIARLRSMNETVRGIRSMADGEHYTILEGNNIVRYGYATAGQGEQMLPKPTANLVVTDYAFSPDERQILIASGARPIYRHSYTTDYFLASGNSLMPVLREAEAPRLYRPCADRCGCEECEKLCLHVGLGFKCPLLRNRSRGVCP